MKTIEPRARRAYPRNESPLPAEMSAHVVAAAELARFATSRCIDEVVVLEGGVARAE